MPKKEGIVMPVLTRNSALIIGLVGLVLAGALILLGGGLGLAVYHPLFWLGIVLLYVGVVYVFGATTWSSLGACLLFVGVVLLLVGWLAIHVLLVALLGVVVGLIGLGLVTGVLGGGETVNT